jgi:DNA excision repair protein ERCC-4
MSLEGLLPFHRTILEEIHDPSNSQLVLLARGLGLRKIVCTLMQIYDQSTNLVLLVNASSDEEAAIGEELGLMGCRKPGLRTVSYEMGKQDRWVSSYMSHVMYQSAPILTLFCIGAMH